MPSFHGYQISGPYASIYSSLQPSGLLTRGSIQRMLSASYCSLCCSSSRPGLLSTGLSAIHLFRKFQFRQRICIFYLFVSIVSFFDAFLSELHHFSSSQVLFSGSSTTTPTTTIRFPSTSSKYVVSAFYPGSQPSQACVFPAFHDGGSSPCLLGRPSFSANVFILLSLFSFIQAHDATLAKFFHGLVRVGSLAFQNRRAGTLTGLGSRIVTTMMVLHCLTGRTKPRRLRSGFLCRYYFIEFPSTRTSGLGNKHFHGVFGLCTTAQKVAHCRLRSLFFIRKDTRALAQHCKVVRQLC